MTWVEVLILFSVAALIGAIFVRPVRMRRAIQILAGITLVVVLAIFGKEMISDLF